MRTSFIRWFLIGLLCFGAFTNWGETAEQAAAISAATVESQAYEQHADLFTEERFPSAFLCAKCHPKHFHEWSMSQHAYAQLSPIFNSMQAKITHLTSGTNGDFCIRCHTQVGMTFNESLFMGNLDRHPVSQEGVTCITCHRAPSLYGISSGRVSIEEGDIFYPVYGPKDNEEVARVIAERDKYKVVTSKEEKGRSIHKEARTFFQLTTSGFCGSCHDVRLVNGFRLEDAFSEYKHSPAAKRGVSCQDCHMGKEPGVPSGYEEGPAAIVSDIPTRTRKLTNHVFPGPDYSVIHPALFPHNPEVHEFAPLKEWLTFDYQAGWGTDAFEDNIPADYKFPVRWNSVDDRYDAHELIEKQRTQLDEVFQMRKKILRVGYQIGQIITERSSDKKGIRFRVEVKNGTDGHGVPTGFDAERLTFLQVTVTDQASKIIFQSGDLDPNGDVRDLHSHYVHNGELPQDKYLFNLQTKFITLNRKGGEREQVLPVNYSIDPLPFVRPETLATPLYRNPRGARKHKRNIPPLESRWAEYEIKSPQLTGNGPYKAHIALRSAMVPVNLVLEVQDMGFDYGMSTRKVVDALVAGHVILWEREVEFDTAAGASKEIPVPADSAAQKMVQSEAEKKLR